MKNCALLMICSLEINWIFVVFKRIDKTKLGRLKKIWLVTLRGVDHVDIGGGIFFLEQGSRPEVQPRVYCLAPEKNPPLISTTSDEWRCMISRSVSPKWITREIKYSWSIFLKPFVGYDCRLLHWMVRAKAKIAVFCIMKRFLKRKQNLTLGRRKNDGFLS